MNTTDKAAEINKWLGDLDIDPNTKLDTKSTGTKGTHPYSLSDVLSDFHKEQSKEDRDALIEIANNTHDMARSHVIANRISDYYNIKKE